MCLSLGVCLSAWASAAYVCVPCTPVWLCECVLVSSVSVSVSPGQRLGSTPSTPASPLHPASSSPQTRFRAFGTLASLIGCSAPAPPAWLPHLKVLGELAAPDRPVGTWAQKAGQIVPPPLASLGLLSAGAPPQENTWRRFPHRHHSFLLPSGAPAQGSVWEGDLRVQEAWLSRRTGWHLFPCSLYFQNF